MKLCDGGLDSIGIDPMDLYLKEIGSNLKHTDNRSHTLADL
jgi:hypothetical protein